MSRGGSGNSNMIPLGQSSNFKKGAMGGGSSLLNPSYLTQAATAAGVKPIIPSPSVLREGENKRCADDREGRSESREERKKKRKSRWESETTKTVIPGLPTTIPADLTPDQEKAYLLQLKIEEASRKLRTGELGIPPNPEDRSPSPEPVYGQDGKRVNTREYRTRKKVEEQRHEYIQQMLLVNPDYKPPSDYRAVQTKVVDKVMIPQDDHPQINFVGLLIGPRGNTLKMLEKDSGAKIIIRGKGSVKEGKVPRVPGQMMPGEDEPLHAYVTSPDAEAVKKAVNKIKQIITQGIEVPENNNELRKNQLKELALLNGTLREDGTTIKCSNCGADNHRSWQCEDRPNITNSVTCTICGGAGHISKDCRNKRPGEGFGQNGGPSGGGVAGKMDLEYMSLMAELGEGPSPSSSPAPAPPSRSGGGRRSSPPPLFNNRAVPPPNFGGGSSGPTPHQRPPGGGNNWNNGPNNSGGGAPWQQRPPGPPGGGNNSWGGGGGPRGPPPPGWQNNRGPPPGCPPPQHRVPPPSTFGGQQQHNNGWNQSGGNTSFNNHQGPPPGNFGPPGGWGGGPGQWGGGGGNNPGPVPAPVPPPNRPPIFGGGWGNNGGGNWGNSNNQQQLSNILSAPPPPPPPS